MMKEFFAAGAFRKDMFKDEVAGPFPSRKLNFRLQSHLVVLEV